MIVTHCVRVDMPLQLVRSAHRYSSLFSDHSPSSFLSTDSVFPLRNFVDMYFFGSYVQNIATSARVPMRFHAQPTSLDESNILNAGKSTSAVSSSHNDCRKRPAGRAKGREVARDFRAPPWRGVKIDSPEWKRRRTIENLLNPSEIPTRRTVRYPDLGDLDHLDSSNNKSAPSERTVLTKGARSTGLASSSLLIAPTQGIARYRLVRLRYCTLLCQRQLAKKRVCTLMCVGRGQGRGYGIVTHAQGVVKRVRNSGGSDRDRKIDRVAFRTVSLSFTQISLLQYQTECPSRTETSK